MWSSEQDSNTTNPNPNPRNRTFGSSSSSSRSSLSSNGSMIFPLTPRRTMDDVWKDISLMTPPQYQYHPTHHLHQHYHNQNLPHGQHQSNIPIPHQHHQSNFNLSDQSNPSSFKGMILQDFLAGPLNRPLSISPSMDHGPTVLPPIPAPSLPPTSLSLNSVVDFSYLGNSPSSNSSSGDSRPTGRATETSFMSPAFPDMMMDPDSTGNLFSFCSKKRVPDGPMGGDRRQKRMIKNRESAARSRARKQAYATELEQNVQILTQENEMLMKQCEKLRLALERQQSTRHNLQRCGSCSF